MTENSNNIKKQGMTVREYVGENKSAYLVIKYKKDNTSEEAEYREYFDALKNAGTIISGSYNDDLWICFADKDSPTKRLSFSFMEAHPKIEKTVKNYLLVKLYVQKCSLVTVKKRLMHIRHFMEDTDFMNSDNVKDYQIIIGTWNENKKREAISIKEFLQFSSLDNAGLYYDVVKNIKKAENHYRELPNFQGVLIFDFIVNDYWEKVKNSKDRYRLFPVILWWKLTTVIPTRPIEFFNLKRDCIYEKNGRYFFKIERLKTELGKRLVVSDIVTDFEINEELYFLIYDYVDYCNGIDDCIYLISPPTCDVIYRNMVFNTRQKFTYKKMNKYYHAFQKEIVAEQYHYKVVRSRDTKEGELPYIYYGDTRHLAIMNMMLQGINPVYIAQLAGHHTLDAQVGYYSHLETFTSAKSYILSQFMKGNSLLKRPSSDVNMGEKIVGKELMGVDYYSLPKVAKGQGRCSSKNIPYECNHKSCLFCKYFFLENVSEDQLNYYKEENDRNKAFIQKSLQNLFGQTSLINETELQQNAFKFSVLLNQKIMIDSYRYREEKD